MTIAEQRDHERQTMAIEASADALLAVCALQTGTDPAAAVLRAMQAIEAVLDRAEREARAAEAIERAKARLRQRQAGQ